MPGKQEIIVGLDIGTTKICAVVGEVSNEGVDIIGIGTNISEGLRKGVVVDIEATVESIKKAVEEAELMSGCEITSVYVGIAGSHITGFNSRGRSNFNFCRKHKKRQTMPDFRRRQTDKRFYFC